MKTHLINGSVAAVVAAGIGFALPPRHEVTQVTHAISASKHAWPDLTDPQKSDLAAAFAPLKDVRIEILCGDGACTDLALDIDDAAEQAGIDSAMDRPFGPVGYGIGVIGEEGDARAGELAAILSRVTGRKVEVKAGATARSGYPLWIVIGKAPRR